MAPGSENRLYIVLWGKNSTKTIFYKFCFGHQFYLVTLQNKKRLQQKTFTAHLHLCSSYWSLSTTRNQNYTWNQEPITPDKIQISVLKLAKLRSGVLPLAKEPLIAGLKLANILGMGERMRRLTVGNFLKRIPWKQLNITSHLFLLLLNGNVLATKQMLILHVFLLSTYCKSDDTTRRLT